MNPPLDHLLYEDNTTIKRTNYPTKMDKLIIQNTTQTILSTNNSIPTHPRFISLFGKYGENISTKNNTTHISPTEHHTKINDHISPKPYSKTTNKHQHQK